MPRLLAPWFDAPSNDQHWPRLARVLAYTARQQCPAWSIEVTAIAAPVRRLSVKDAYQANTTKLDEWTRGVLASAEGEHLALLDADTWVTGPLDPIWDLAFDVALTRRPDGANFPYNAGVVFVRVSPASRAFFVAWRDENRLMLQDRARHRPWRARYGGLNQAALGALLHQPHAAQVLDVPCPIWNCEDESWARFSPATRIVHVKSQLRLTIFHRAPASPAVAALAHRWRLVEADALRAEGVSVPRRPGISLPRHRRSAG